jgi:uncharacterized membrane protein YkvA (DUF1232 family)
MQEEPPPGAAGEREYVMGTRPKDIVLFVPRLVKLVGRLAKDPEVSRTDKVILGAAIAYVASPFDLIPDFIPGLGELDDIYLLSLALLRLINRGGEEKVREYWDGPEDILAILEQVTRAATFFLPKRIRDVIARAVDRQDPALRNRPSGG